MDIELNVKISGEGKPLVLLHGNGESSEYFSGQIPEFSKKYKVIAVDTRGHGLSPRGKAPFTIDQFAEDLKELMDMRGVEKAHILGFSDGGNIALTFALKYPQYVDRLILNGANLNPKGVKARYQVPIVIGYGIASFCALFGKNAASHKEMLALMVNQPNISPRELEGLEMPVLVIAGSRDMIKASHTRLIYESLKRGRLCIMDGTHFIAHESPGRFNMEVLDFLEDGCGERQP